MQTTGTEHRRVCRCRLLSLLSIIHGDAEPIMALFQSQRLRKIAEENGVPIELFIRVGAKHGWHNKEYDEIQFLNWFYRHSTK
jgi:hypothetical protein